MIATKRNNIKKNKNTRRIFSKKDYLSGDGFMTSIWGASTWHLLHCISFNYPIQPTPEDKKHYMDFIYQLQYVLPCGKCRNNLVENLKTLPLTVKHMKSRETFSKYIYNLHNLVNIMLGKEVYSTYEDIRERYEYFRSRCPKKEIKKVENGCIQPLHNVVKSKCVLHFIPKDDNINADNIVIDKKCIANE